ncbi:MAG: ATP-binding protein [Nocardioides sp.]
MLIGRTSEEARIRSAVRDATACVLVHGEAGVGKSALVRAALDEAEHHEGGALATLELAAVPGAAARLRRPARRHLDR